MKKNLLEYAKIEGSTMLIRDNRETRKLTAGQRAMVIMAIARHESRAAAKNVATPAINQRVENYKKEVKRQLNEQIISIVVDLYRTASSRWAGGKTYIRVKRSPNPGASGSSKRVWSDNGKWSGNNAHLEINVAPNWLRSVLPIPGLARAGGMLTTHASEIAPGVWQASWVQQARGFDLKAVSGYIVRCADGSLVHANTEKAAAQVCKRREAFLRREAKAKTLRDLSASDLLEKFAGVSIIRRDSLRAGNCPAGTDSWIARHFPGRESATVAEILAVDTSEEVVRAVKAGILRQLR
jgi:hypothetical protein